jgi:plastocyanin
MRLIKLISAAVLSLVCLPAFAADHVVLARNGPGGLHFEPAALNITVGDTVTFKNDPGGLGFHNVKSDDGAITAFRCANGCDAAAGNGSPASNAWTATVSFPTAGTVGYHCEIHGSMTGSIVVGSGSGTPEIVVNPYVLSVSAVLGSSTSAAFTISNSGTSVLTWTAATAPDSSGETCAELASVPWLTIGSESGSIAAGAPSTSVDVALDASSLGVGVYKASVCILSNDPANTTSSVAVEFTVGDLIFTNGFDG